MPNLLSTTEPLFTESEAARQLGVSIDRLHCLLDRYIFNNGEPRPAQCSFRSADLVLLSFWLRNGDSTKIVMMPRRF
jgi:hypothetical protein